MKVIATNKAPAALGPYSQAIEAGNTLYVSGCLGLIPETGALAEGGIEAEAAQALKNIDAILAQAGYNKENIVRCDVFLANLADFAAFNKVYADFFGNHKPARNCVQAALVKGAKVEICPIAVK